MGFFPPHLRVVLCRKGDKFRLEESNNILDLLFYASPNSKLSLNCVLLRTRCCLDTGSADILQKQTPTCSSVRSAPCSLWNSIFPRKKILCDPRQGYPPTLRLLDRQNILQLQRITTSYTEYSVHGNN